MKRHLLRLTILAFIVLAGAALVVGLPAAGIPGLRDWFRSTRETNSPSKRQPQARLVPGRSDELELPPEVVERLGVTSEAIKQAVAPRSLELAGSLFFDPNRYGSIQSRFAGEVVAIGPAYTTQGNGTRRERPLESGDVVAQGQIVAVVLSKDLGEKKSELVDNLVQLALDEVRLVERQKAYSKGGLAEDQLNQIRRDVAVDRNAVEKGKRILRTWKVPEEEIEIVKQEARLVSAGKKQRDAKKELEWAKVEVKAPFDATILEKNASLGKIVDPAFDLFKIADLRKLSVVAHAYEEDLRTLRALTPGFPWQVRAGAELDNRLLKNNGIQKIGLVVDPAQHTDPIMGLVENSSGELRVGQFVTATVHLPAPPKVVSLPSSAVAEDGAESIVFVQPDPGKLRYLRRRVSVAMRLRDVVYVRSELIESERKRGLETVKPGEILVTEGVLELQATLEDLQARAKAQK